MRRCGVNLERYFFFLEISVVSDVFEIFFLVSWFLICV